MKNEAIKTLIQQGWDKEIARHIVSNMSEWELLEVIEQGGI